MNSRAFSIVELSIILIIIALLISAFFAGSKLVGQAKLRSIINDYHTYRNAYNSFYLTYDELPGDMSAAAAQAFFGVTNKNDVFCPTIDNDGVIIANSEGPMAFWHMMLAGIIKGSYNGNYAITEVSGVNLGVSSYSDTSAYNFLTLGENCNMLSYGSNSVYEIRGKNILLFGDIGADGGLNKGFLNYAILKPLDALNLDNKLDDGVPNSGIILADHGQDVGTSKQCTNLEGNATKYSASVDGTLSYMKMREYAACRMMFIMDF